MAYIEPLTTEEALSRSATLRQAAPRLQMQFGFIPNSIRTMAHRPKLVDGFLALQGAVMGGDGTVSAELKKLVAHVASKAAGCLYCQAHTTFTAGRAGTDAERLANLWDYQTSDLFSEAERVALDYALAAGSVPNGVTESLMTRMRVHWCDEQIVEILGVISFFGFLNRWNDSMATTLEDPAQLYAADLLGERGWTVGKHTA